MKIAFLDTKQWEKDMVNQNLGPNNELQIVFEETDDFYIKGKTFEKIQDAKILSVFIYHKLDQDILSKMPNLKMICTRSTGFDHIDLEYCKSRGIVVCNVPCYGENTVAEYTFALLLAISRQIVPLTNKSKEADFEYKNLRGFDLMGKTIGIIGTGKIGMHTIKMAKGFGMKVLGYDVFQQDFMASFLDFEYTTLDNLLSQSDIISLHAPYNKHTHHMMNKDTFSKVKKGAVLINTSRGGLVDNNALTEALNNQTISFAGLDVIDNETDLLNHRKNSDLFKLISRPNVIFTPHTAFYSKEAEERILITTLDNIQAFRDDKYAQAGGANRVC